MPKVIVKVTPRPIPGAGVDDGPTEYPGYGCAGKYWPNGETRAEVTDAQFAELKTCSMLAAYLDHEAAQPSGQNGGAKK